MEGALVGARRPGQRGLEAGAQGEAEGQSRELREPRADRVSLPLSLCPGHAEAGEAHGPPAPYLGAG